MTKNDKGKLQEYTRGKWVDKKRKCSSISISMELLAELEIWIDSQEIKPSKVSIINKLVRDFLKNKD